MLSMRSALIVVSCLLGLSLGGSPVWDLASGAEHSGPKVRTAALPKSRAVKVQTANLKKLLQKFRKDAQALELSFDLGEELLNCKVGNSNVLDKGFRKKLPSLFTLYGNCEGKGSVSIVIDTESDGSFSATVESLRNGLFYIDHAESETYTIYKYGEAAKDMRRPEFTCEQDRMLGARVLDSHPNEGDHVSSAVPRQLEDLSNSIFVFRIAILTTRTYSQYFGNTISSVLAGLATLLVRLNGVFMRELGIMLQLIPENDKLICLNGDATCENLPNDSSLYSKNYQAMFDRGVGPELYDIGHSLSTGVGGLAQYRTLCSTSRSGSDKARGTTGSRTPANDPFVIDYVAHELGHQLNGDHTYSDCGVYKVSNVASVEPGSGSTIMAYSGVCGSKNAQINADPYYNGINLPVMRGFIELASTFGGGCGIKTQHPRQKPIMSSVDVCRVPKGSYVQLSGRATNQGDQGMFYAWDQIDVGFRDYQNISNPRFRSWSPTESRRRFLPNLYYLRYGVDRLDEVAPLSNLTEDTNMTFRLTGRTRYDNDILTTFDVARAGLNGYVDVKVTYLAEYAPLAFTNFPVNNLFAGNTEHTLTWSGGQGLATQVEILLAVNTMRSVVLSSFDYQVHVKDLEWVSLGVFANSGIAVVTIPDLFQDGGELIPMLRSFSGKPVREDECYFFALAPAVRFKKAPIPATCNALYINAGDGCDCDCHEFDPDCSDPKAAVYCHGTGTIPFSKVSFCDFKTRTCKTREKISRETTHESFGSTQGKLIPYTGTAIPASRCRLLYARSAAAAAAQCTKIGARLCTDAELLATDEDTRCGLHNRFVWSNRVCGRGKFYSIKSKTRTSICRKARSKAGVRCCTELQ